MIYEIQKTAQKGQVLLISKEKRGACNVVSQQLPEQRARQIVAALQLADDIASGDVTSLMACLNEYHRKAKEIKAMPIEN